MRKLLPILVVMALPLAACATSPYGYGYNRYAYGSDRYGYNPIIGAIGALGGTYGGYGFSQAAASACANYASRYGAVQVTSVRQTSSDKVHVYGYVSRGYYGRDDFDCSFRADGRISDFDL